MKAETVQILLISTDVFFGLSISDYLKKKILMEMVVADSLELGIKIAEAEKVEVIIIDISDKSEWEDVLYLRNKFTHSQIFVLANDITFLKQFENERFHVIEKPFNLDDLIRFIEKYH